MATLSLKRCPCAPVRLTRSLPARSSRWNLEALRSPAMPPPLCSRVSVKMAWERLEWAFISVAAVTLHRPPSSRAASTSATLPQGRSLAPSTHSPPPSLSRMGSPPLQGARALSPGAPLLLLLLLLPPPASRSLSSSLYSSRYCALTL